MADGYRRGVRALMILSAAAAVGFAASSVAMGLIRTRTPQQDASARRGRCGRLEIAGTCVSMRVKTRGRSSKPRAWCLVFLERRPAPRRDAVSYE